MAYLRDLLMPHGVLSPVDRHLMLFQRSLGDTLAGLDRPERRQVMERFAACHGQRRLRRFAEARPVTAKQTQQARAEVRLAIPLPTRLTATLILLYTQPLTRIPRLRIDDVLHQDNALSIRLGDPPTPLPEPFAKLLDKHINHRLNLTTATNPDARWLFPGRRGGQPMTPDALERRLRQHQIPALNSSTAATRPASTSPCHRHDARLQPRPHHPTSHRGRRNLDPLRSR